MAVQNNSTGGGEVYVKSEKKSRLQAFSEFFYDSRTGMVLGRSASSWCQILVFYVFFYSFLAGFFATCLVVFMETLDENAPKYFGKGSLIGINPGMGYQPWLKDDPESTLIHFNVSDEDSYQKYVAQMEYKDTNNTRECTDLASNNDNNEHACRFDLSTFDTDCGKGNKFGYADGKPCIILSLNRLIGWRPVAYPKNSVPDEVKDRYDSSGSVAVDCEGEYFADKENLGKVKYIPNEGLHWRFFPYKKVANYHQPIAMVKLESLPIGTLVEVECHAYAYNILQDQTNRLGMVHFEVLVDK